MFHSRNRIKILGNETKREQVEVDFIKKDLRLDVVESYCADSCNVVHH